MWQSPKTNIVTQALTRWIFLPGSLDARQNAKTQKHHCPHYDPMCGHVHEIRSVNQSTDYDSETTGVQSKGHGVSSLSGTATEMTIRGEEMHSPCERSGPSQTQSG